MHANLVVAVLHDRVGLAASRRRARRAARHHLARHVRVRVRARALVRAEVVQHARVEGAPLPYICGSLRLRRRREVSAKRLDVREPRHRAPLAPELVTPQHRRLLRKLRVGLHHHHAARHQRRAQSAESAARHTVALRRLAKESH